jgi:hypothetical protein
MNHDKVELAAFVPFEGAAVDDILMHPVILEYPVYALEPGVRQVPRLDEHWPHCPSL